MVKKSTAKAKQVNIAQMVKTLQKLTSAVFSQKPQNQVGNGKNNPNKTKSMFLRGLLWGSVFTITVSISATLGAGIALILPSNSSQQAGESANILDIWAKLFSPNGFKELFGYKITRPVNILVLGIDRIPDSEKNTTDVFSGRSDTILLVRFDPRDHSLRMLSIPRDTRVEDEGLTIPKINQANAEGGAALTAKIVSRSLNNIAIDRYVRVTTDAFIELVDLVGGVEVFVPQPMHYVDQTQKLEINLDPGWQTLNGEQAEQFVRFRKDRNGDIGRVQRQQMLLKALKQKVQSPAIVTKIPDILKILEQYVDTNLSLEEMLSLATFAKDLDSNNFKMVMLPGRFSDPSQYQLSYWLMSEAEKDQVMTKYFDQNSQLEDSELNNDNSPYRLRIAIQNATNQPAIAHEVAEYLRGQNFTNVYLIEDSRQTINQTEIIAQKGDLESAQLLQKVLQMGITEASSTGDLESDLTIRVGEDWLKK